MYEKTCHVFEDGKKTKKTFRIKNLVKNEYPMMKTLK